MSSEKPLFTDETVRKIGNVLILLCGIVAVPAIIPSLHYATKIVGDESISEEYRKKIRTKLILGCFWVISSLGLGIWIVYINRSASARIATFQRLTSGESVEPGELGESLGSPGSQQQFQQQFQKLPASQQFQEIIKALFKSSDRVGMLMVFINLCLLGGYLYAFSQAHNMYNMYKQQQADVQDLLKKEYSSSWAPIGLLIATIVLLCLKYGLS